MVCWRPQHAASKLACPVQSSARSCCSSICAGHFSTAWLVSLVVFSCRIHVYFSTTRIHDISSRNRPTLVQKKENNKKYLFWLFRFWLVHAGTAMLVTKVQTTHLQQYVQHNFHSNCLPTAHIQNVQSNILCIHVTPTIHLHYARNLYIYNYRYNTHTHARTHVCTHARMHTRVHTHTWLYSISIERKKTRNSTM